MTPSTAKRLGTVLLVSLLMLPILLGATVLSVIDKTNMNLIPTFTPWDTMGTSQEYYW